MVKEWKDLSKSSRQKYTYTASRLEKAGLSVNEAMKLSDSELAKAMDFKGKNIAPTRRNIKALSTSLERKINVKGGTIPRYQKEGYTGRGLNLVKTRINKTLGLNTFYDIAKEVQKQHKLGKKQSYKYTHKLLKKAKLEFDKLDIKDKGIINSFFWY